MYLFEYKNFEICIVVSKIITVVKEPGNKISIKMEQNEEVVTFDFETSEEADNVYIELVQAIQDFYAK